MSFSFHMPKMGGGQAASAFKSADLSGKLGMIGAALGDDPTALMKMISPAASLGPAAGGLAGFLGGQAMPQGQPQVAGQDQAIDELVRRMQGQSGMMAAPDAAQRPRFGFGFRGGSY